MRAAARLVKAGRSVSHGGSVRFSEEASEAARRGPRWRIVARLLHDAGEGHAMRSRLGLGVIGLIVALVAMALAAPAEARRKDKAPMFPVEAFRENESTADWLAAYDRGSRGSRPISC